MIHEQFPYIGGLTDCSIGKCQQFDIAPRENGYIQILHPGSMHWICVASKTSGKLSNQVLLKTCNFIKNNTPTEVLLKFRNEANNFKSQNASNI